MTSLTDMLKDLSAFPPPPTTPEEDYKHTQQTLPEEEKHQKAWEWKMQGVGLERIAKVFNVSTRTIQVWQKKHRQRFRDELEGETVVDLLAGHFLSLENIERTALYEIEQLTAEGYSYDHKTGKVVARNPDGDKVKNLKAMMDVALKARKMSIELGITTGILPTDVKGIHQTIGEKSGKHDEDEGPVKVVDKEMLVADIMKQYGSRRSVT